MSEEHMNDSKFGRLFIIMIIAMTVLTIIIAILASFAASDVNAKLDKRSDIENTQSIADRIAPVGKFSATTVAAAPVEAVVQSVEEMYTACCACHATGVLEAPVTGTASDWAPRLEIGIEAVYNNAINGINAMPARGGNAALTDDNVKAIVDYMLEQSK